MRVPHAANRNQLNDEIPRAPNQPLVPGLGNRLLRLGGIFGIARRDHEIVTFIKQRLHLVEMRDIRGVVSVSEETQATRGFKHSLFDRKTFATIYLTVEDLEMGDLSGHRVQDAARVVGRPIENHKDLIAEGTSGEIFVKSSQRLRQSLGFIIDGHDDREINIRRCHRNPDERPQVVSIVCLLIEVILSFSITF